jgi:hypothetical protein
LTALDARRVKWSALRGFRLIDAVALIRGRRPRAFRAHDPHGGELSSDGGRTIREWITVAAVAGQPVMARLADTPVAPDVRTAA